MSQTHRPDPDAEGVPSPAAVEAFLRANPGFLAERPGLYRALSPPERVHGEALADQFGIGAVPAAGHAVGHHGGEQAFDAAEQGEGQGGRQHGNHLVERDGRQVWCRQAVRNATEPRADGLYRQAEHPGSD